MVGHTRGIALFAFTACTIVLLSGKSLCFLYGYIASNSTTGLFSSPRLADWSSSGSGAAITIAHAHATCQLDPRGHRPQDIDRDTDVPCTRCVIATHARARKASPVYDGSLIAGISDASMPMFCSAARWYSKGTTEVSTNRYNDATASVQIGVEPNASIAAQTRGCARWSGHAQ